MAGPGFAVIDFETTGIFPNMHDRVIEVAVVHVDVDGAIEGRWETLVNPGRDLGPQRIHGIRGADIVEAPTFEQIAAQLVELLAGRVLVAHNASFDMRFLVAELERSGAWIMPSLVSLCTMQLARDFLPGAGRALADCCAALDIEIDGAHRASADAFATARLLAAYIEATDDREFWHGHIGAALDQPWPTVVAERSKWIARPVFTEVTAASFLERITIKMPEYAGPAECLDYLALLDLCLLDRRLSVHEARGLVFMAEDLGISRTTCEALHLEYFDELTRTAWADGILTEDETVDLLQVGDLLDLSMVTISAALEPPRSIAVFSAVPSLAAQVSLVERTETPPSVRFQLRPGDLIVLTGEMSRTREAVEATVIAHGFTPSRAVTKKVRLLVAADPDSLSGKARKARDYGIPIVDEAGLERLIQLRKITTF